MLLRLSHFDKGSLPLVGAVCQGEGYGIERAASIPSTEVIVRLAAVLETTPGFIDWVQEQDLS